MEERVEKFLRAHNWLVVVITLLAVGLLITGIWFCMIFFERGYYWTVIPAAILAHAYFVIVIHDGAHKSISRTAADHVFSNLFSGFLLLPFYPEPFRKYHLLHHGHTNKETDPLWAPVKADLYKRNRYVYMICQMLPLAFTVVVLINSEKYRKKNNIILKGPAIRWYYVALAFSASALSIWLVRPPVWFVLGTLFCLAALGAIRHWCEHMGTDMTKESNTYWFPLGMGVGNHDFHHDHPGYSWISLMIGLYGRKRDTNPLKTIYGMLFVRSFAHYESHKGVVKPRDLEQ